MAHLRLVCLVSILIALACSSDGAEAGPERSAPPPAAAPADAPAPAAPRLAAPQKAPLTVDMAAPYFGAGAARHAAERFALEDWQAARQGFARYLDESGQRLDRADRARVMLLMAEADARLGQWTRATRGFARAAGDLPLIADYIHYQAARAFYFARDAGAAMTHARKVSAASIRGAEAEMLIGDLLRGARKYQDMAAHYARYLADRPEGVRRAEARYRLAQAYEELGKAVPEALDLYRALAIGSPLSSWGKQSQARMDVLVKRLGKAERERYDTLSADELIERGMVYYDAMRNPLSEADFERALSAPGLTDDKACVAAYHRANSVFKARDRQRAAPLFDQAIAACKKAKNVDLHVKAAYQAGRSYSYLGKRPIAIERYRVSESVSPEHTFVDDARLRQAEEYAELGNDAKVRALLASIPKKYPGGDMRAEALWRLGWRAYSAGKYKEAITWLEQQIAVMPIDDNYWAEGQAQYWLGRSHARLGRTKKSIAAYRDAVLRYPLSYYALLALNRLREQHPAAFESVMREIQTPPADYDPARPAFQFAPRVEYGSPAFARALEFLRLGLGDPAEAELRRLGMNVPPGKDRLTDPDRMEKLWATAFLYDRAGSYEKSHWPTRWHILDYKRVWPVGHNRERWRIAYPRGFWELIEAHAKQHGFPTEILMAIVREESAFNPLLESYANAIGLTQMIMPTAQRFAKDTGIEVNRTSLRDPEKNVTIGARFLAFLWEKWDRHIMLVPPSYNAGEGAVSRMLGARGHLDADEWIESIKTDQARRYSKRVLASYFVYNYLYRGEIPVLSNDIPDKLVPGHKAKTSAGAAAGAAKQPAKKQSAKKRGASGKK
jgi:soluble lytic murein transglycosylase